MTIEFLDIASKAAELATTEGTVRAKLLSQNLPAYLHVHRMPCFGTQESFLPAWEDSRFPYVRWQDFGTPIRDKWADLGIDNKADFMPRYQVTGWVKLSRSILEELLSGAYNEYVLEDGVLSLPRDELADHLPVRISSRWTMGFYSRKITKDDLAIPANPSEVDRTVISSRREQSLMRVIAAMLALLRHEDGGSFPSQAKVIDALVEKYGLAEGVSKRNLEDLFPSAVKTAGLDLKPKD